MAVFVVIFVLLYAEDSLFGSDGIIICNAKRAISVVG